MGWAEPTTLTPQELQPYVDEKTRVNGDWGYELLQPLLEPASNLIMHDPQPTQRQIFLLDRETGKIMSTPRFLLFYCDQSNSDSECRASSSVHESQTCH